MERQTMRRVALLCAWMLFAAACSSALLPTASQSSSATHSAPAVSSTSPTPVVFTRGRVEMGDNFFAPEEISVVVGATVTWQINQGENNHDVASTDGLFHSNVPMTRGVDMFMYTFTKPGVYSYVCSFHVPEGMTGKIIVK
jgi:plastocyanin